MHENISKIIDALSCDGLFVISDYLKGDALKSLHDETLKLCTEQGGHYEFGRNYRGPALNKFPAHSAVAKIFNASWMKQLHNDYKKCSGNFGHNVFATHDYIENKSLARNGWLHFDRLWCLKFFIYLTDITEDCGAFFCSVGSVKHGEKLRKAEWRVHDFATVKNRIDIDHRELLDTYRPQPIEGKAGTLIVFDTDAFHKGGIVKNGKERLVVRLHCK